MSECLKCALYEVVGTKTWEAIEKQISQGSREFNGFEVVDWFFDPADPEYSYYDAGFPQGHEGVLYIIFTKEDRHFRKTGRGDSYGHHYWDGPVTEVFPKKVMKTVYEYEEK